MKSVMKKFLGGGDIRSTYNGYGARQLRRNRNGS